MIKRILIIGGYGNFGSFISSKLAIDSNIQLIIAGRSFDKAKLFCGQLGALHPAIPYALDINNNLITSLKEIRADLVIHTSGPFQNQRPFVAEACIECNCHYIDLADARDFVSNIKELHDTAIDAKSLIISGASSVPCLTSALIDHYHSDFTEITSVDYAITTAQKTNRGVATTAAILSYTGKPFQTLQDGKPKTIYGWQDINRRKFKQLGNRYLGNCDVPDLTLFQERYPSLKNIRFQAGIEIPLIHISLWALSWLVRIGIISTLERSAGLLQRISYLFDFWGSDNSAFQMTLEGSGHGGRAQKVTFDLTARSGDGPYIPCMPAIILAKRIAANDIDTIGAYPCMGFITADEYLTALSEMDITWEDTKKPS